MKSGTNYFKNHRNSNTIISRNFVATFLLSTDTLMVSKIPTIKENTLSFSA